MEENLMTSLDKAIKDGYAIITGPENKQKITYVTSDNHIENYNDPEEIVRAEFWAELIYEYDYPASRIKVEVTIPDRMPTDRADIVIFSDDECKKPYAVVECKRDGVTDAELSLVLHAEYWTFPTTARAFSSVRIISLPIFPNRTGSRRSSAFTRAAYIQILMGRKKIAPTFILLPGKI